MDVCGLVLLGFIIFACMLPGSPFRQPRRLNPKGERQRERRESDERYRKAQERSHHIKMVTESTEEAVAYRAQMRRSPRFKAGDPACGWCQGDGYDIDCGGHPFVCRCVKAMEAADADG